MRIVLAKSFARIHRDNLVNYGILPLTFADAADYDAVEKGHSLTLDDAKMRIEAGAESMTLTDVTLERPIEATVELSDRQRKILLAGGLLRHVGRHGAPPKHEGAKE